MELNPDMLIHISLNVILRPDQVHDLFLGIYEAYYDTKAQDYSNKTEKMLSGFAFILGGAEAFTRALTGLHVLAQQDSDAPPNNEQNVKTNPFLGNLVPMLHSDPKFVGGMALASAHLVELIRYNFTTIPDRLLSLGKRAKAFYCVVRGSGLVELPDAIDPSLEEMLHRICSTTSGYERGLLNALISSTRLGAPFPWLTKLRKSMLDFIKFANFANVMAIKDQLPVIEELKIAGGFVIRAELIKARAFVDKIKAYPEYKQPYLGILCPEDIMGSGYHAQFPTVLIASLVLARVTQFTLKDAKSKEMA